MLLPQSYTIFLLKWFFVVNVCLLKKIPSSQLVMFQDELSVQLKVCRAQKTKTTDIRMNAFMYQLGNSTVRFALC